MKTLFFLWRWLFWWRVPYNSTPFREGDMIRERDGGFRSARASEIGYLVYEGPTYRRRHTWRLIVGWWRCWGIGGNFCPACNSDAPAIDTCKICGGYDPRTIGVATWPPTRSRKKAWWENFKRSLGR